MKSRKVEGNYGKEYQHGGHAHIAYTNFHPKWKFPVPVLDWKAPSTKPEKEKGK